jgi:D-alanine transaminase
VDFGTAFTRRREATMSNRADAIPTTAGIGHTVYVNGTYLPASQATVSIFDRGFLFADGMYEAVAVIPPTPDSGDGNTGLGKMIDFEFHISRLNCSVRDLAIEFTSEIDFLSICRDLIRLNQLREGIVYIQITRGCTGDRDFVFPSSPPIPPTIILWTQAKPGMLTTRSAAATRGLRIITLPDLRWHRRDIKTTQLLYQCLARTKAKNQNVDDAWLVEQSGDCLSCSRATNGNNNGDDHRECIVTEGTTSNVFIVKGNKIITKRILQDILPGVTRASVLRYASTALPQKTQPDEVEERNFTVQEAMDADEAFQTSSSLGVVSVVEINGVPVGSGKPGPVAQQLYTMYLEESSKSAI